MRVTVTGSSGFIAKRLSLGGHFVQSVDLSEGLDITADVTRETIRHFDPEIVFHLAAKHFIPWCEDHPDATSRINVGGTINVLEACGPSLRTFVFASSAAVYGFGTFSFRENDELLGRGIYAETKKAGEWSLGDFSRDRPDVRCVTARLFNVVGTDDRHAHILPWIVGELCSNRAVTLGNLWPKRDYVHVADAARALQFLAGSAPPGQSFYNIGTGIGTTVAQLLALIEEESGRPVSVEAGQPRSDDGDLVSDPGALKGLGFQMGHTLREAVREVIVDVLHR